MTKLIVALMCAVLATSAGVTPVAAQRGTPAEAQALLKKAVEHYKAGSYVGTSADALKDAGGKPLGKAIIGAASGKSGGSVRYRWMNPVSGKIEPKVSFVQKVGQDVCGVGAYQPD